RVVFVDAENVSVLKAAQVVLEDKIAHPILLGNEDKIHSIMEEVNISLPGVQIIDPQKPADQSEIDKHLEYSAIFLEKRKRKGITALEAEDIMRSRSYYGAMMVETGDADAMIGGLAK